MRIKQIVGVILITILTFLFFQINNVQAAALQSNGDTPTTKNRNTWMTEIRKMESVGGVLGLVETQNEDLTTNGNSNKLDIHMQKNTEYGAMALLSASSYGKSDKVGNGETTTGNATGVVIPGNYEATAAQHQDNSSYASTGFEKRYINYYEANFTGVKPGDAYKETSSWHGSEAHFYSKQYDRWGRGDEFRYPGIVLRGGTTGIFGYYNLAVYKSSQYDGWIIWGDDKASLNTPNTSRAVIVNGEGL